MVVISNNWISINSDDQAYMPIKVNLSKSQPKRTIKMKNGKVIEQEQPDYRYYIEYEDKIYVPVGLLHFIKYYISRSEIKDIRSKFMWDDESIFDIEKYRDMLEGISLRDEQLIAIRKAVIAKRGIIQMPTGSGKSEVMCGIVKYIQMVSGEYPTVLILEPTVNLVNSTVKRFRKYNIPAYSYCESREIKLNSVNICHPASLCNDIEKNTNLLDNISILIGDECHHFNAEQFRKPTFTMPNLVMSIGVSASVISQEHVGEDNLGFYDIKEVLAFSATGPLLMNIITGSLIDRGQLADPVLLMIGNKANETLPSNDPSNWHEVSKVRLESENRNRLVADCAEFFADHDRKSLILVKTIRWSRLLLEEFHKRGLSHIVRASYGGGRFERFNGYDFDEDPDTLSKFESGEYQVLIGTTHLYEGADIPNLDVIILAYGGKGERTQIQGIGRALRRTKNGKYAYIVDFMDQEDPVLSKHSEVRMKRYLENIQVPDNHIFYEILPQNLENIFRELEE